METDGPFSGDSYLGKEFEKLVQKFKIKNIVETGTFLGETSREFSKMVENVYTIESNEKFYLQARKNLKRLKKRRLKKVKKKKPKTQKKLERRKHL